MLAAATPHDVLVGRKSASAGERRRDALLGWRTDGGRSPSPAGDATAEETLLAVRLSAMKGLCCWSNDARLQRQRIRVSKPLKAS